jgi:transposase-like protein
MASDTLVYDRKIVHQQERIIAMRKAKIVNRIDVLKDQDRILGALQERVKSIVLDVLGNIEVNLAKELRGIGLEVMRSVMEFEISSIVGAKGKHQAERRFVRWGSNPGSVVIDGMKLKSPVPRVLEEHSGKSFQLKTYGLFRRSTDLVKRAYRDLIRGISTRRYAEGVEAFLDGHGISSSSVSRRMITATAAKVEELFSRSLAKLELAVLMLDGVDVGGHAVIIALGIDTKGVKHILGLRQGATENAVVAKGLLEELVERGLDLEHPILVVIDGAKALRKAVTDVLGENAAVQRCTVHKRRNVLAHLPKSDQAWVSRRMLQAYDLTDADKARNQLDALSEQLEKINPSAAKSLLEGLEETLTVQRLRLPEELRHRLRSTNMIESTNNGVRDRSRNVKRWRDGLHVERWTAASLLECEKKFRRINGYQHMNVLIAALNNDRKQKQQAA